MTTRFKQYVETFEDPFTAASNVERREQGLPDYTERSMPGLKYLLLYGRSGNFEMKGIYYISDEINSWSREQALATRFNSEEEVQQLIISGVRTYGWDRNLAHYRAVPVQY